MTAGSRWIFRVIHYGDVPKIGVRPVVIHFSRIFHYKPSISGYPHSWKHPYVYCADLELVGASMLHPRDAYSMSLRLQRTAPWRLWTVFRATSICCTTMNATRSGIAALFMGLSWIAMDYPCSQNFPDLFWCVSIYNGIWLVKTCKHQVLFWRCSSKRNLCFVHHLPVRAS